MKLGSCVIVIQVFLIKIINCNIWPDGVVHYYINTKDYDVHSQDVITSTLKNIEKEVCLKFFHTHQNYSATVDKKLLFISNPNKVKDCPPVKIDYSGSVVNMVVGYKCLNSLDLTRIVVDVIRASINPNEDLLSSHEIKMKQFAQVKSNYTVMLHPNDRNYINEHYHKICNGLGKVVSALRSKDSLEDLRTAPKDFYADKVWPLGVVLYGVDPQYVKTKNHGALLDAMGAIEQDSCVVFQQTSPVDDQVLEPKNRLWFGEEGADEPTLGFQAGRQEIKLDTMVNGADGHVSHTLNNLMRTLGIPMASNQYDRDNYIVINWKNVQPGKEYLLERVDQSAFFSDIPYDFSSATHAPVNYICNDCQPGQQTVTPRQDYLWQRTMLMGRSNGLSETDKKVLDRVYGKSCRNRHTASQEN